MSMMNERTKQIRQATLKNITGNKEIKDGPRREN